MYTCCVVIVCGVSAVYIILYNRKPTLPITNPTPSAPSNAAPSASSNAAASAPSNAAADQQTEEKPEDNSSEEKKEPIATPQGAPSAN